MIRKVLAAIALMLAAAAGGAFAQQQEETAHQAFDAQIPQAPVIVPGPNGPHLVYELHLTNFARTALTLTRVDVTFQDGGSTYATYEGAALERALGGIGPLAQGTSWRVVQPGMRVILYVRAPTNGIYEPPSIGHRIFYELESDGAVHSVTIGTPDVQVDARRLRELGPPLRGGPWVAVYGPDWERGHRRYVYAIEGRARVPGRFAIDWMPASGGDGLGAEVLAVADGTVVAMRDDFPEGTDMPRTLGNATGNYVAIDIGGGRYAFYEHLAEDVPVSMGQRVRRGQVIGRLGLTGSTTQPHLHFHVADANSPLQAEGLPYVLRYTPLGVYDTIEQMNARQPWDANNGGLITPSFPAPMMVVMFPD